MQEMQERVQGDGRAVQVRFGQDLFSAVESWRRRQLIIPSRPAAIRELIRISLAADDSAPSRLAGGSL